MMRMTSTRDFMRGVINAIRKYVDANVDVIRVTGDIVSILDTQVVPSHNRTVIYVFKGEHSPEDGTLSAAPVTDRIPFSVVPVIFRADKSKMEDDLGDLDDLEDSIELIFDPADGPLAKSYTESFGVNKILGVGRLPFDETSRYFGRQMNFVAIRRKRNLE